MARRVREVRAQADLEPPSNRSPTAVQPPSTRSVFTSRPVTQHIRERINRKLDALGEDRLYQILDYVEFLESRYAQRAATPPNSFQRFADAMEDRLRTGGIAASTVSEAMGFLNRAAGVLNGVAAAGRSVATDLATAAQKAVDVTGQAAAGAPSTTAPGTAPAPPTDASAAPPPTPPAPPPNVPPAGGASGTPGAGETPA